MTDLLDLVKERLEALAPALTSVEVIEDIEAIAKGTPAGSGAAFVAPYRERGTANELATGFRQLIWVEFLVAFQIRIADDSKGTARVAAFRAIKGEIETALAGWQPTPEAAPISLIGGQGGRLTTGVSTYVQTWETTRYLTG